MLLERVLGVFGGEAGVEVRIWVDGSRVSVRGYRFILMKVDDIVRF